MRAATIAGTGVAWGVAVADMFLPDGINDSIGRFVIGVAVCGTGRLMLWCHNRPIAQAYEFGYGKGRRDQLREANSRPPSPIRRPERGLSELNHKMARKINGHRVDA